MSESEAPVRSDRPGEEDVDPEALAVQLDLLAEENDRLRREYVRARRAQYRRSALGIAALGLVALGGAALFPAARTVLIVLGATGLFAGLLTYYVTPERFVTASVSEGVYRAAAANGSALVDELGLAADRVYVPLPSAGPDDRRCTLFVPQSGEYVLPDPDELDGLFVVSDDRTERGVALHPIGAALFRDFERALAGSLADEPGALADQLADGLVETFELADAVTPEVSDDGDRIVVGVDGSAIGSVERFDHPIPSFLAAGLAIGLDAPVRLGGVSTRSDRADVAVTFVVERSEAGTSDDGSAPDRD